MRSHSFRHLSISLVASVFAIGLASAQSTPASSSPAPNPEMQQKVADLKEAMAKNKQALAQYT